MTQNMNLMFGLANIQGLGGADVPVGRAPSRRKGETPSAQNDTRNEDVKMAGTMDDLSGEMTIEDYRQVYELWTEIKGLASTVGRLRREWDISAAVPPPAW